MREAIKAKRLVAKLWEKAKLESPKDWSLRKTAVKVGISPSYMSLIFSGKKALTKELSEKFITVFNPAQLETDAIRICFRSPEVVDSIVKTTINLDEIYLAPTTAEWLLGKWYRLAILDLLTIEDFSGDIQWISKRLGIPTSDVELSLNYFQKEGLAAKNEEGSWYKVHQHLRFPANASREAIRNHHKAQLRRIEEILEIQNTPRDYSRRLIIGISAAVNVENLDDVKAQLEAALYRAAQKLSNGPCTEVYQINLQLFPQTKEKKLC